MVEKHYVWQLKPQHHEDGTGVFADTKSARAYLESYCGGGQLVKLNERRYAYLDDAQLMFYLDKEEVYSEENPPRSLWRDPELDL